jgi:glutathione S-transferase
MPRDVAARALVRIEELECVLYCAEAFRAVARQLFFTPPERRDAAALEAARADVRAQLERLETRAAQRKGQWIAGDALTRADLTWLPFVEIAGRGGIALDPARTPWLVAWRDRMRARPSYERSYPPHWRRATASLTSPVRGVESRPSADLRAKVVTTSCRTAWAR